MCELIYRFAEAVLLETEDVAEIKYSKNNLPNMFTVIMNDGRQFEIIINQL